MGKSLINHPPNARRTQRLSLFCKEIKRILYNRCIDHNFPLTGIEYFVEEHFICMQYHDLEYPLESLLLMLKDDEYLDNTFQRYLENI